MAEGSSGGGKAGYTFVQASFPADADAEEGDTIYRTDLDEAYAFDGNGTWHKTTVGDHGELSGVGPSDHHTKTTDHSELSGVGASDHHSPGAGLQLVGSEVSAQVTKLQEVTAFDGSDGETVTHTDTETASGSIELLGQRSGTEATIGEGGSSAFTTTNRELGFVFQPNMDIPGVRWQFEGSVNFDGTNNVTWVLENLTTSTQVTTKSVTYDADDGFVGDKFETIEADLNSGDEYAVWTDYSDSKRWYTEQPSYPVQSSDIDVTDGWDDGRNNTLYWAQAVLSVIPAETSGSATVEVPMPSLLDDWDVASFQRTLDSETVDVFVAYNDGSGWSRTNAGDPISKNYDLGADSNISPADDVRFEIELSRADTANNPSLDALYRRYTV